MSKTAVITMDDQGNYQVTICASQDAASALRDRMDDRGVETYGTARVVSEKEAS